MSSDFAEVHTRDDRGGTKDGVEASFASKRYDGPGFFAVADKVN